MSTSSPTACTLPPRQPARRPGCPDGPWLPGAGLGRWALFALIGSGCLAWPLSAPAGEVVVAVAANFARPLTAIARDFQSATGHVVKPSPGPTGRFFAQIAVGGAPFEVLLAADQATPAKLLESGHAVAGTDFTYAVGQLVLWSPRPGRVDDRGQVLRQGGFDHLAVANPKVAPYGQAAMAVLKAFGLEQSLAPRLVTGDSIAQAWQFVASGNAELGFVALSQVMAPDRPPTGSMWRVPQSLYPEIRQDAVLLKAGADNPAAVALLAYLKQPAAKAVMAAHGYR